MKHPQMLLPPVALKRDADVRRVFTAVMLPMFLGAVDQTLMAAATPAIAAEMGSLVDTTWVALAYLVAATATVPLYGRVGDRFGRRDGLLSALLLFGAGCAVGMAASSMAWLVAARALQGLGGGGLMVLSQALIGERVAPRERARYQGWFAGIFMAAGIGGLVIGGFVVHHAGWRWLFGGMLPLTAVAIWVVRSLPAQEGSADAPRPDIAGFTSFAFASALALIWLTFSGHRFAWWSLPGGLLALAAAAAFAVLVVQQRGSAHPLLPLELLAEPPMRALAATVAINAGAMFSLVFFLPVMVQLGQGGDAVAGGLAVLPLMVGTVVASMASGRWIARSGRIGALPRWGLAWAAAVMLVLAVAMPRGVTLGAITMALGLGLGAVMSTAQIMAQAVAGPTRLGAAAALASLSRSLGTTFGAAAFSAMVYGDLARQQAEQPAAAQADLLVAALRHGFVALAAIVLLGSLIARRLPSLRVSEPVDGPVRR